MIAESEPEQLAFWPSRKRYTDRMELRLDHERRRRLAVVAEGRRVPKSQVIRDLIDEAYESILATEAKP